MKSSKIWFGKNPILTKQIGVNILCQDQKGQYNKLDEPTEKLFQQTYKKFEIYMQI